MDAQRNLPQTLKNITEVSLYVISFELQFKHILTRNFLQTSQIVLRIHITIGENTARYTPA